MEVVQTLVCASRPSSSHPPPHPRLSHRLDGDPTSALHVQTEEGGGGLDPSWWKISASGSWDGGERRMRYGKLIDDGPVAIPGAVQRRKLEMLETHAPGASMRVVHSQSTASWMQDPTDVNGTGLNSSISSSRRGVLASSSSSTRVTSFRQWSSNFTQNSNNSVGIKHETRPAITEFGNLELALNPLDVSFLRTRGNVGRSGSIGARRPPSRGRRLSTDAPLGSPVESDHSDTPSPIPRGEVLGVRIHDIAVDGRREENYDDSPKEGPESRSEWPLKDVDDAPRTTRRLQTVLHRKRSVSSEDVRAADESEEDDSNGEDPEGNWRRGAAVRRSLPSSEWRSAVGAAEGTRQRLRPRDPFKSSSVPALGGSSSPSRRGSFVTEESLREMKGRLKHRGGTSDAVLRSKAIEAPSKNRTAKDDAGMEDVPSKPRSSPFLLRVAARENTQGTRQQQEGQDDRRKSWSVGCKALVKRSFDEENDGTSNRRRSYAFEYSAEENGCAEDREDLSVERQLQEGRGDAQRGKLWVDPQPYVHSRVNEVLKKWSALSKGDETEEKEDLTKAADVSPMVSRRGFEDERGDSPVKNSTTWLEHNSFQESSPGVEVSDFSPATLTSSSKTTLRVIPSKGPHYKDDVIADVCVQEKETSELSFSVSGESMDDYMSSHGLAPIDWPEDDSKASKEVVKNEPTATSAGISVTFSNADGDNNLRHRCSVTHLDNRDNGDVSRTEAQGFKIRSSKKVEFSKTEVHFAAESGRFHIVETAGKPPPSNNFRRRRRSPTGTMNVDSGGRLGPGMGSQLAVTNGMRFGDSPYEVRLLAGSESLEHSSRRNEEEYATEQGMADDLLADVEESLEYKVLPGSKAKVFNELVIEEERETKETLKKVLEVDVATPSSMFLHLAMDDLSPEKPRSILRSIAAENSPPWKSPNKDVEEQSEDFKPKFGGVRLRPVVSPAVHSRVNVTRPESPDLSSTTATDKSYADALSPGQMELQKLLRSLRHVSMTYSDNPPGPSTTGAQVANGGGMEVRISSSTTQSAISNTVIIGNDSTDINTPLSVAQRVREVEERRQKELLSRIGGNQKTAARASGQFSTRVTLGSASSSVVSLESQVHRKTSVSQIESAKPVSPKPAAKLSTHNNKIARIHNAQGITSRLAGDSLQHSQVATTSDIKISAHLTENLAKLEHSKDVPMVTCIALGYQGKAKDCMKNAEPKDESKGRTGHSTVAGGKIDGSLGENPKRIASKSSEPQLEPREKSPEEAIHSRSGKYNISSLPKDAGLGWRSIDAKIKKDDDLAKSDPSVKGVRSQRRVKETASNVVEKSQSKTTFTSLSSPTAENKSFPSDATSFETFKDDTRIDDVAGNFSIKMKVIKSQADEEKSSAVQDQSFQGHTKTSSQCDYLQQRRTNTITTASKITESECSAQKSRKESSPRTEPRTVAMQASKSPMMDHRNRLQTASSRSGNPETSSPSSGRAVRKRLRKRGSGGSSKTLSSSDRKRDGPDDDSSILEELTKAADEILHAVNGYSDEGSSDEDVGAAKSESRSKRRPTARKESASRKLSSSSGRESKGGSTHRNAVQKVREGRTRTTNGTSSPSMGGAQGTPSEAQIAGTESPRESRGTSAGLPAATAVSNSHSRGSNVPVVSEKSQRSKQQPLSGASKKSMTRIEPTNRVAEVKLIEKRPPLPPTGQRRPTGLKERSEATGRGTHGKPKTTSSLVYNKDGDVEVIKETKRPINIARALEAVMPDSRTKTRKIDQKVEGSSISKISDTSKKDIPPGSPASVHSSPGVSHSLERKKVASSRDGDKITRRRVHQNITSPT